MIPGTAVGGQGIIPIFTSGVDGRKLHFYQCACVLSIGGNPKGSLRKSLGGESWGTPTIPGTALPVLVI